MGKRRVWYTLTAALTLIGMITFFVKGVDYGIDFLGGTELIVRFEKAPQISEVRAALVKGGMDKAEVKSYGSDYDFVLRTLEQGTGTMVGDNMRSALKQGMPGNNFTVLKEDKIGPKIGAELRQKAFWAVFWSIIAITIYVAFRFKWIYGVGVVVATLHDVLFTLGLVSIFDGITPNFHLEITQDMIAAFLTLVGLSVNDTVVIFDRIRENQKLYRSMSLTEVINKSLNETLSRTVITSGLIFLVLVVMLIFGGEVFRGFAFTLTVGIVIGTYSSIYIASAIVVEWSIRMKKKAQLID
ncbi:MAG: protein translocase subunit SecF [bacterium]